MDTSTYDQFPLTPEQLGDALRFLKENDTLFLLTYDGKVLGIDLPTSVELTVTQTDPGFKGDTANAAFKPATVETGLVVDVPQFFPRRGEQHAQTGRAPQGQVGKHEAVHAGHDYVGEEDRNAWIAVKHRDCLFGIGCIEDRVTRRHHDADGGLAQEIVVFDDQDERFHGGSGYHRRLTNDPV